MSLPHTPPAATAAAPAPVPSGVWKIIVALILVSILLVAVTIGWMNRERSYNLAKTKYNHVLKFNIKPGHQVRVKLTYDYIKMWSSGPVERYNSQGTKVTMKGSEVTPCDSFPSTHDLFVNKEDHSITIKIGRYKSKKDSPAKF
jgi:hypothetical protein